MPGHGSIGFKTWDPEPQRVLARVKEVQVESL